MATYYFRNAGANWGDAANWSLTDGGGATGAVPTNADDVIFTNNSGNCTVNTTTRVCRDINFNGGTGYAGTITFSAALDTYRNVTLSPLMTFAGAGGFNSQASTATWTSNGKTMPQPVTFWVAPTITVADNWTFNSTVTGYSGATLNGNNFYLNNGIETRGGFAGTTTLHFLAGTINGLLLGNNPISNPVVINGNITISSAGATFGGNSSFTYTSGTISGTGIMEFSNGVKTLSGNLTAPNIRFTGPSTFTISGTITATNTLRFGGGNGGVNSGTTLNSGQINLSGSLINENTGSGITGTTQIVMNGTGTWTAASGTAYMRLPININTSGTITISGTIEYSGTIGGACQLTYTSGTILLSNVTLSVTGNGAVLDYDWIQWTNLTFNVVLETVTILKPMVVNNLTIITFFGFVINGNSISVLNNLSFSIQFGGQNISGTSRIIMIGSGSISETGFTTGGITLPLEFNTKGIISFSNISIGNGGVLTYSDGVMARGNQVTVRSGATLRGSNKAYYTTVVIDSGASVTMDEFFCGIPQRPTTVRASSTTNYTINFQNNFEKIARFVNVSNCTVGRRSQLLVSTKMPMNNNNVGIRYINQSPNSIKQNASLLVSSLDGVAPLNRVSMLVGDPVFT